MNYASVGRPFRADLGRDDALRPLAYLDPIDHHAEVTIVGHTQGLSRIPDARQQSQAGGLVALCRVLDGILRQRERVCPEAGLNVDAADGPVAEEHLDAGWWRGRRPAAVVHYQRDASLGAGQPGNRDER